MNRRARVNVRARTTEAKTWTPFVVVGGLIGLGVLVLGGVSLFFVGMGVREAVRQHALLARAVATPAEVLESRVESVSQRAGGTSRGRSVGSSTHTVYRPVVRYAYADAGGRRESERVFAVGRLGGQAWAQGVAARYAPGAPATAYVDPLDPASAVLERVHTDGPYLSAGVGGCCLGVLGSMASFVLLLWPRASARAALAGSAAWLGVGAWALWHYLGVAGERLTGTDGLVVAGFFAGGVLVPAGAWFMGVRTARSLRRGGASGRARGGTAGQPDGPARPVH